MNMLYLKEDSLNLLKSSIKANLDRYRTGGFGSCFDDATQATRELKGKFRLAQLKKLKKPSANSLFDPENSEIAFKALSKLTPMQAREERIWSYLCHFDCLDYVRARWPVPNDDADAVKHILTHYFASAGRGTERDNGISRLWWMGFIADRVEGIGLSETLEVLMYKADVRANIIERPGSSTSVSVLSAILRQLKISYKGKRLLHERDPFRDFMKEINSIGGVQLLQSLSSSHLNKIMEKIISNRLGFSEI